jgi:hypothetical protein
MGRAAGLDVLLTLNREGRSASLYSCSDKEEGPPLSEEWPMQPSPRLPQEDRAPEGSGGERMPRCPRCSGRLVPLRDAYRCARCSYSICAACEGAEAAAPGGD